MAAAFVLAGSSAVVLAMHARSDDTAVAYQSWPPLPALPTPATKKMAAARTVPARQGLRLMSLAVTACRTTAFRAVEVSHWPGPDGGRMWLAEVWHQPGAQTVAQTLGGTLDDPAGAGGIPAPSASMVISAEQLALLREGYVLSYAGSATADGRSVEIVVVERSDGALAARYWLDRQTGLPLRRQLFDSHAHVVSDSSLTDLRVGPAALQDMPTADSQPGAMPLSKRDLAALRAEGWPLPGQLPGGMLLLAASQTLASTGPLVGLSYSDGLSVISLFVQHGQLPAELAGWRRMAIGGHEAYAIDPEDPTFLWSGDGYVFTMIGDAPSVAFGQAVAALPHAGSLGFWTRLERGFRRLASWANPFR